MLTQLSTLKSRLNILDTDTTQDALLTSAIKAVSARFDKETNRTLARTVDISDEFDGGTTEVAVSCYPIESVQKFEVKTNETDGWVEQSNVRYLIRNRCVISLQTPFSHLAPLPSHLRLTYTGGYVLPGDTPGPGQTPLPDELEHAAIEQIAFWFQHKDHLGLKTYWPSGVAYYQFASQDLLDSTVAVLQRYRRICI